MKQDEPLISCLMVTRNRPRLAKRAIKCFVDQTWKNKELIIFDDGNVDYSEVIKPYTKLTKIEYHQYEPSAERNLGDARNISLELANGELLAQWDDDEWYHPDRLKIQADELIASSLDAVVLKDTLMHVNQPTWSTKLYRADASDGTPGTILHKKTTLRYPNTKKSEDSVFLKEMRRQGKVGVVTQAHSHLFIRCFHGANTWNEGHFRKRLRRTPKLLLEYIVAVGLKRDLFTHRAFQLSDLEKQTAKSFIEDSKHFDLLS